LFLRTWGQTTMTNTNKPSEEAGSPIRFGEFLREHAEEIARENGNSSQKDLDDMTPEETRQMLHELRVNQIELEMQNEELRRTLMELDNLRARYVDLYDQAPVGYCTISEKGLIQEANLTAATLLGVSRSTLVDQSISRFIYKDDQDIYYLHRKLLFETGAPQVCELRLIKKDASTFWARLEAAAWQDADGSWICRVTISDITACKQTSETLKKYSDPLEELVEERTKQLQQAVRLATLGEIAAMIGHDLRNPLQVIISMVYLAKEILTSADNITQEDRLSVIELLNDIEKSSIYMNKIVSDLQSYAGPLNLELAKTDIHQLISDALSILEIPDDVEVSIEVDDELSEIIIDPEKIKRSIVNLVNNSAQSMPNGGQITITAIRKRGAVVLTIKDEGMGILNENMPKLFLPLFTTKAKGIGLGLTICKRLVEAHRGSIVITSKVNAGTEAIIEIPQDEKTWTRS